METIERTVWCDMPDCEEWCQVADGLARARAHWTRMGWRRTRLRRPHPRADGWQWECPGCVEVNDAAFVEEHENGETT